MSHVPGPWKELTRTSSYITIGGGERDARGLPHSKPGEVAYVPICRVYRHSTSEENANMIIAAPDLYEALCDMVSDRECLSQATIEFAQRALAKARGEL